MPSTYSTSLKIELIGDGEQSGIWGQTTNNNLGTLIEQAITGVGQISLENLSTYTLTSLNGLEDQARNNVLVFSGLPSNNCVVTAPAVEKVYIVSNEVSGGYTVTVKTSGGNGITILNGAKQLIYCDGADFYTGVSVNSIFGDLTVSNDAFVSGNVSVSGKITVNNNVSSSFTNVTMTANSNLVSMLPNTGGFIVPTGTTAQRPSSPLTGMARWNIDLGAYEIWNGAAWENIAAGSYDVSFLIAGGGGGGGGGTNAQAGGGGGGAGGLLSNTTTVTPGTSYVITVGSGGGGGTGAATTGGSNGSNSIAFSNVILGGGGGACNSSAGYANGNNGASGGGGYGFTAGSGLGGSGTSGQGNNGAATPGGDYGGGGGGFLSAGSGAAGGAGASSSITGSSVTYAAGGTGGVGGNGAANTGNGGNGGVSPGSGNGGNGSDGVVIIRYAYPTQRGTGGNVTSYISSGTKYYVHTFTTSGTFIA